MCPPQLQVWLHAEWHCTAVKGYWGGITLVWERTLICGLDSVFPSSPRHSILYLHDINYGKNSKIWYKNGRVEAKLEPCTTSERLFTYVHWYASVYIHVYYMQAPHKHCSFMIKEITIIGAPIFCKECYKFPLILSRTVFNFNFGPTLVTTLWVCMDVCLTNDVFYMPKQNCMALACPSVRSVFIKLNSKYLHFCQFHWLFEKKCTRCQPAK